MLDTRIIGDRIKELRKRHGLTQSEFAAALNVSFQAVSNWERGIAPPELENLINISAYFSVLVDDILRPKSEDIYLGIDGGGTKTDLVLTSSSGYILEKLAVGGCNPNDIGYGQMVSLLTDAIKRILTNHATPRAIFCGISGILSGNYIDQLKSEIEKHYPTTKIEVNTDSLNLLALDDSCDIAIISGTGSAVIYRDGDGFRRLGGWGYLIDSAGSAYDIGRDAIRLALREEDCGVKQSLLSRLICEKLGVERVSAHIRTLYSKGKPYIASLARTVFEAYKTGDTGAAEIIDKTAFALAELVNIAMTRENVRGIAVASGGLFEHYAEIMTSHIQKYSDVKVIISDLPPVFGAVRRAAQLVGCEAGPEFRDNYKKG